MNTYRPTFRPILLASLLSMAALGSLACQSTSTSASDKAEPAQPRTGHVDISNEMTSKTIVLAVDKTERLITLRREDGSIFAVQASSAVRNLDQIEVGDTLRVRYQESLAATLQPPGTSTAPVEGALGAGRARAGDKPAGAVGMAATARVKIESIDQATGIVVFSLSSGELRSLRPARPEGREFVKRLKIGDVVQIDYAVSVALAVDKL